MTKAPKKSTYIPTAIEALACDLKLRPNQYALLLLLDGDTTFIEFRANSSDSFLDHLQKWKARELPALIKSDIKFFVARMTKDKRLEIKAETFPLYRKRNHL